MDYSLLLYSYTYRSFNYCNTKGVKAITIYRKNKKRSKELIRKLKQMVITNKSDNFIKSNREKSNIAIILGKSTIDSINIIFAYCRYLVFSIEQTLYLSLQLTRLSFAKA